MFIVNAVDSFCHMKLRSTSGKGEKKLYLSSAEAIDFASNYLGVNVSNGSNCYTYNDELKTRTIGYRGYVSKRNLLDVFEKSAKEYTNYSKYRVDLDALKAANQNYLDNMNDREYFKIDCSISENRIYIGSKDANWLAIPSFAIPKESKIRITNLNDSKELEFFIMY